MPIRLPHLSFPIAVFACLCLSPLQKGIAEMPGSSPLHAPLSLSQVVHNLVANNAARAQALRSYQSRRTYTLAYKGFPAVLQASMVAKLAYQAPDTKTFTIVSIQGSKLLVNRVLKRLLKEEASAEQPATKMRLALDPKNYRFEDLQYAPALDGCSYSLFVEPIVASKYLYRGRIWINVPDFAVCRMEVQPAKNPSFWIKSTEISEIYAKHGQFWLPKTNTSISRMRIGGRATLTIHYGDYTSMVPAAAAPGR